MTNTLDVLAVGPHPDDVELSCGGAIARWSALGYRVGVLDLSRGELGTRGTPELRQEESRRASAVLGLSTRENLGLPDGAIGRARGGQPSNDEQLERVVTALRQLRPELLVVPYWHERHPDHEAASELLTRAVFFAGLSRFLAPAEAYLPRQVLYYQMRHEFTPSFVVDTTGFEAKKLEAIRCYASQIESAGEKTLLSSTLSLSAIEARDRHYGALIGVEYGEPFLMRNALALSDPLGHFRTLRGAEALYFRSPA